MTIDLFSDKMYHEVLVDLHKEKVIERIWKKDFTLWSEKAEEIANRLGWLDAMDFTDNRLSEIDSFVKSVIEDGITNVLLLGMGGSSLAPEVFSRVFGSKPGYPELQVLDSTHPDAVNEIALKLDIKKTLFIVSTKSGGTIETISLMKFFFKLAEKSLGREKTSNHFAAITDPGSGLQTLAEKMKFRKIFLNDPDIGGRFSALSLFGMVPAALCGIDIARLLTSARDQSESVTKINLENLLIQSAAMIGLQSERGKDKLTFFLSEKLFPFGIWIEQLLAESTGKMGKGLLPVIENYPIQDSVYSDDRLYVFISLKNENKFSAYKMKFIKLGISYIEIVLDNLYELGAQFFYWEMLTAIVGWKMCIQPFDQPDVESAKVEARDFIQKFKDTGKIDELAPDFEDEGIKVVTGGESIEFKNELARAEYIAIQAYLPPDSVTDSKLSDLKLELMNKYKCPVTVGYGPRFLHSTGQLHKGDGGKGFFIQLFSNTKADADIPELESENSYLSFGTLIKAQSLGDRAALITKGRKALRFEFDADAVDPIGKIKKMLI